MSPSGTITTVAGTGAEGFSGDGGPATAARMGYPNGVSATADGGFLIADYQYNRVRRVSPTGTITTVAGTGGLAMGGFSGHGGPATEAELNSVADAVETPDGGVLIVDTGNNRILAACRPPAPSPRSPAAARHGPAGSPATATSPPSPASTPRTASR